MVIERNCALSKVILPFYIQFPAWISVSLGIRLLGEHSMIQNLKGVNLEAVRF